MTTTAVAAPATLRVVIVIARYPPHHVGGYELRCRDVARELARRGHSVTVLTSREGRRGEEMDEGVRVVRELHHFPAGITGRRGVTRLVLATRSDVRLLRRMARKSRADVVSFWHLSGLTSALFATPLPDGCGVLNDVSSDWLRDVSATGGNWFRLWEQPATTTARRLAKGILRPLVAGVFGIPVRRPTGLRGRTYFLSEDKKRTYLAAGVPVQDAAVIRSGIDLAQFRFAPERAGDSFRIVFLGRLKRRKGLHTVILALGDLPASARLRAIGAVEDPEYLTETGELARAARVMDRIEISAPVPHSDVAAVLEEANALVFPSEEPESFSRLVLEAFAVGTPVVGTTLGGTGEVLREGETGLTFAPGNARELARQLRRVLEDAELRDRIVRNARKLVEERYSLGFTVNQIESLLRAESARARSAAARSADARSADARSAARA